MEKTKPFNLPKQLFVRAYEKVKANAGTAGVDQESIKDFERNSPVFLKCPQFLLWFSLCNSKSYKFKSRCTLPLMF